MKVKDFVSLAKRMVVLYNRRFIKGGENIAYNNVITIAMNVCKKEYAITLKTLNTTNVYKVVYNRETSELRSYIVD